MDDQAEGADAAIDAALFGPAYDELIARRSAEHDAFYSRRIPVRALLFLSILIYIFAQSFLEQPNQTVQRLL